MRCPKCGSTNCQVFVSNNVTIHSSTKGFGVGKACCGSLCLGPIGLLCGAIGSGRTKTWTEEDQQEYWICQNCGSRFTQSDMELMPIPVWFYLDHISDFVEYENDPIVKKFMKSYAEDWRTSILSEDIIVRQSNDERFIKHKDSCEEKWFEGTPILFAVEDCTGVIVTGKDIIIDTVRIPLNNILYVAIQNATIYIGTYCLRFSSHNKTEKFFEILKDLLDSDKVHFIRFDSYDELLVYLQDNQNGENTSQKAHFSSQIEYENFVKSLTEKGLDKMKQDRPQLYRNYEQTEQDEEKLRQPLMIAYIIQMAIIFLIRIIFVGFWNAIFNTIIWGIILGVAWFLCDSKIKTQFEEEKRKYLPPELFALVTENKLSALQKAGNIRIAKINQYVQLPGLERIQDQNLNASIKQWQNYLYGILVAISVCITILHLFFIYNQ